VTSDARFSVRNGGQLLLAVVFLALAVPAQAQQKPDFSVMPKLQEQKDRPAAPDFALPDPAGKKFSLKDYRGKVVMLAFWATWCEYCREEIPAIESLYRDFKGKGLEIVAINIKDKREDALAFIKKNRISYPVLMDPEGEVGLLYGAYATPTVYLIDRKGAVLARQWGPAGWNGPEARKLIAALVEQKN
jgi:DsbE subfamily thiol:disulfide oxidoreductase